MKLYLIRHAHAQDDFSLDQERPLTEKGRAVAKRLGKRLAAQGPPEVAEIRHSGYVRARETAEILAREAGLSAPLRVFPGLAPEDEVEEVVRKLENKTGDLMLVGHEPFMGRLASLLICGDTEAGAFKVKKGTLIHLENQIQPGRKGAFQRWSVCWMLTPEVL